MAEKAGKGNLNNEKKITISFSGLSNPGDGKQEMLTGTQDTELAKQEGRCTVIDLLHSLVSAILIWK